MAIEITSEKKRRMLFTIAKLPLHELASLNQIVSEMFKDKLAKEEKRQLKSFKIGDEVVYYSDKRKAYVKIKVTKLTSRKVIGADPDGRFIWKVSPILCRKA